MGQQILQHCTKWAVNWLKLAVSAPLSEESQLQGAQFPHLGALDWKMVSTTSVERPEAMSCAPSGPKPTASTTPSRGERTCPPPVRGKPSWRESPMESQWGEKSGPRTIDRPEWCCVIDGTHPGTLYLEFLWAEGSEKGVQMKPRPSFWELDESGRTRGDSAMSDESQTDPSEPRPLPRQDVCSHIEMPSNMNCSQQEELILRPHMVL